MNKLTKQDIKFVDEVAEHGNQTKAAQEAYKIKNYGYARVKGSEQLTKPNIQLALAERLPDDLLEEKHLALLNKTEKKYNSEGEIVNEDIDVQAVSKGLDMAYKIKGSYAPEKSVNLDVEIKLDERTMQLAQEFEEKLKNDL